MLDFSFGIWYNPTLRRKNRESQGKIGRKWTKNWYKTPRNRFTSENIGDGIFQVAQIFDGGQKQADVKAKAVKDQIQIVGGLRQAEIVSREYVGAKVSQCRLDALGGQAGLPVFGAVGGFALALQDFVLDKSDHGEGDEAG